MGIAGLGVLFVAAMDCVPSWRGPDPRAALILALALVPVAARADPPPRAVSVARARWAGFTAPSSGPPRAIGRHDGACLAGGVPLPLKGVGYQAVDVQRRRHFGHPMLVAFIEDLGRRAAAAGLGTLLIGDMAQPRGGPMPSGHVSHQSGLDVDVWFRLDVPPLPRTKRESIPQPPVVDPTTGRVDPQRWTPAHAEMVRLAASDPRVARVFVGAAVKRDLCERAWEERSWLRRVRPWPGHDDHLHVRLHCPAGSPDCIEQPPPPPGDGCGRPLARRRIPERRVPKLPRHPACRVVLRD